MRRAQNPKPSTYRCPFCDQRLHAMSEHVVIAPEGDRSAPAPRAHRVRRGRAPASGELPTYDDWRAAQPKEPGLLARLLASVARRSAKTIVSTPQERTLSGDG